MPSLISAWGQFQVRCFNRDCNKALSGWYPTREFAICAADRAGAIVRVGYDGVDIIAYCPSCATSSGHDTWWAKERPLPPELAEFYPEVAR